jgi:hypothetical protein
MNRSENRYNAVKKQKKNVNLIWRKEFRRIKIKTYTNPNTVGFIE